MYRWLPVRRTRAFEKHSFTGFVLLAYLPINVFFRV